MNPVYLLSLYSFICYIIIIEGEYHDEEYHEEESCKLYLAPSKSLGFGRGIISGIEYREGDIVDIAPTFTIPMEVTAEIILNNYIYSSENDEFGMVTLGPPMLFNHKSMTEKDVEHSWAEFQIPDIHKQLSSSNTVYTDVINKATKNIEAGQEIFTSYGGEDWFTDREIDLIYNNNSEPIMKSSDNHYSLDELVSNNYPCLSDVYFAESNIEGAGRGLFAGKDFKKSDIITVSPLLILPSTSVEDTYEDSILVNFCLSCGENFDFVLLPIGLLAMINHGDKNGSYKVNTRLNWYSFNITSPINTLLETDLDSLQKDSLSVLDVSLIATKNIKKGEELFLNYGYNWEIEYKKYQTDNLKWEKDNLFDPFNDYTLDFLLNKPQFRFPIELPKGFCPSIWEFNEENPNDFLLKNVPEL